LQVFTALLRRGEDPETIIAAAEAYCASVAAIDDRRFVAQAVTWLRQERFAELLPGVVNLTDAEPSPAKAAVSQLANERWREILIKYRDGGAMPRDWPREHGLPPQSNATRVPQHLRKKFGWL
jgi:hypothetical protein